LFTLLHDFLGTDWKAYLAKQAESLQSIMPLLNQINGYLSDHSGKQIRPTLSLLVARALRGLCNDSVISCAAASEMLHTGTLLHDDVADNSPVRRGAPTVMALYTPTISVLVGDFWLSRVIDIVVDHPDKRVLKLFSKCLSDLAEGEMLQMDKARTLDTTEDDYIGIIYRKTASLFEASMLSAAYSVQASEEECEAVHRFAYHIGLAFQIMDDIFDYSPMISTGKPAGLDLLEKKMTLPLIGALKSAPSDEGEDIVRRIKMIGGGDNMEDMETISLTNDFIYIYSGLEYAQRRLDDECKQAISAIEVIPDSEARRHLVNLAHYLTRRNS